MEEFNVYFFDFDGTLVDSRDSLLAVFKRAYKSVGIEVGDEHILRLMRVQLQQGYRELGAPEDEESVKNFANEIIRLLDVPEITELVKNYEDVKQAVFVLKSMGKKVVVCRHPMPYGDLWKQRVQRFATIEDMAKHECTIDSKFSLPWQFLP